MEKVTVTVRLPSLLAHCTRGLQEVEIQAATLHECFQRLLTNYPLLKIHLFDEEGERREHVLFFYNSEKTDWLDSTDIPLRKGDRVTILQAVSGG
jgi:molybdopterin converting factor small subunit